MTENNFFKEPYEIICKKLELAELTLKLGNITRQKWERLDTMKDILKLEEDLIRQIAEKSEILQVMLKQA